MDNPEAIGIVRQMTPDTDIVIVGGGLNGPALALALAQAGRRVTVIDALAEDTRKTADFDGRAYALALASQRLLAALGLWPRIADDAQPMLEIKVTDGHAGAGPSPFLLHFDHAEIEDGPMGYMVEDRHLRRAFLEAMAAEPAIIQLSGRTVVAQEAGVDRRDGDAGRWRDALGPGAGGLRRARQRHRQPRRHQAHRLGLRPDRAGLRGGP